jgi:hypothetical protein
MTVEQNPSIFITMIMRIELAAGDGGYVGL